MSEFRMPSLGADMDSGTLVEWKKQIGESVKKGDIIAVVETAKGVVEIEVFDTGIVDEIFFNPGQEIPVGQTLAMIRTPEEIAAKKIEPKAPSPAAEPVAAPIPAETLKPAEVATPAVTPPTDGGERQRVSPLARRMAAELNVDLNQVQGTGPGGSIQRVDIERAAKATKPAPAPTPTSPPPVVETKEIAPPPPAPAPTPVSAPEPEAKKPTDFQTAMRHAIALAMARSNREIPHYYLETPIDMTKALRWLEEENTKRSVKDRLLLAVVLIKAVAMALTEVPELNGFWKDDQHVISEEIHIGFAIALRQGGLITPAIHNADMKDWDELREGLNDLIMRTRAGRLRSSELTDSTITVTSLGERGVEKTFGVIYPPQVALVGMGKIIEKPWVENGMIGIRPVMVATLAGDHRATDGRRGGIFLEALNQKLQEVEKL